MFSARNDLLPPPLEGLGKGFWFAFFVHGLLIAALAFGVHWRVSEPKGSDAELWAAVPQAAAPQAVKIKPVPVSPKVQTPKTQPEPDAPVQQDAQIALEKARQERESKEELARLALEKEKRKLLAQQKEEQAQEDRDQLKKEQQLIADKKRKEQQKEELDLKAQHEANVQRILNQAGSSSSLGGSGRGDKNAGPSAGYAGKVVSAILPNVFFTSELRSKLLAEVEVRVAADGTIVGRRLTKSSGMAEWDEAVLRAIDLTAKIPLDGGRAISPMTLVFDPQSR
jgi:colicin import membrane protein